MAIRLPSIPQNPSSDFMTNFKLPSGGGYNQLKNPWEIQKTINPTRAYGIQPIDIPINTIAEPIASNYNVSDNTTAMNEFNDPGFSDSGSQGPGLPYIPPINPIGIAFDVVSAGLNLFGGMQKSDAQRAEAEAKQKYYNDLATYKEKLTNAQAYQIQLKSADLVSQEKQLVATQSTMSAAAGFSGQSLTDIQTSDALSFQIDKEMIKRASELTIKQGYDEAAQYRRAGQNAVSVGNIAADNTLLSTVAKIGMTAFGKVI
jgi:hypothetical protein